MDSRRDFLKKSAVAGGLVWAAPAISTVAGRAGAQAVGSPACRCTEAEATGLFATGTILGVAATVGPLGQADQPGEENCVATASTQTILLPPVGVPGKITLKAVCGRVGTECDASSDVAKVTVTDIPNIPNVVATVLSSNVNAPCDCSGTGDSSIATLKIGGVNQTITGAPNQTIDLGVVRVVINEQTCDGSTSVVRALRITITTGSDTFDVFVAESRAGNNNCPCAF